MRWAYYWRLLLLRGDRKRIVLEIWDAPAQR